MPTKIRKVVISAFGDESNVHVVDAEIPDPAPSEVQVKVLYSGFSGADINMRLGVYPLQKKAPLTPGYCLVGRVHAAGAGSHKFARGALVAALTKYDAEAELANLPEKYLVAVPAGVDVRQATALVLDWTTAYGMVHRAARVAAGQRVFVHGASGAVGYAVMKLAQLRGAHVYGTASAKNHAAIRQEGGTPFVYTDKNWMAAVRELGGADAVFDPLGFESFDESYAVLSSKGGVLVGYGGNLRSLTGKTAGAGALAPILMIVKLYLRNLAFWSGKRTTFFAITRDDKDFVPNLEALLELSRQGKIQVPIKQVCAMDQIQDAHRSWAKGGGVGSILIKVAQDEL